MSLEKLLKPRRVAIVGASDSESLGGRAAGYFHASPRFAPEDIFFVNPKRDTLFGQRCYHSLDEVPTPLDMVVIATAKKTVEGLVRTAHEKGAEGVVIYASGYGETGSAQDKEDEARLREYCHSVGMSVLGPNCAGYINFIDGVYPYGFYFNKERKAGGVGVVSQSGQICSSLLLSHKANFSYLISCGNGKITTVEDYLQFLVRDKDTRVIAAYIEGVTKPAQFVEVLREAAEFGKPVVLIKSGRSAKAAQVAASHTGSLTGADQSFDAIFRKFGVIRADDIEELACIASTLELLPRLPESEAIAVMCGSGGESAISADQCEQYHLDCPEFDEASVAHLKKVLPDYATPHNPLDMTAGPTTDSDVNLFTLRSVVEAEGIGLTVVGIPLFDVQRTDTEVFTSAIEKLRSENPNAAVVCVPNVDTGRLSEYVERLRDVGVPVLTPGKYAYSALEKIRDYIKWRKTLSWRTLELALPDGSAGSETVALSEHESKELLRRYGISAPMELIATSQEEAAAYAEKIGFPVVLKVESSEILHKTNVGGVLLNICTAQETMNGYDTILRNVAKNMPGATVNGVLVQKMLPKGTEMIVGVHNDRQFGPMILFGMGGIFVEVFKDVSLYPAPFGKEEAMEMIRSLRSSRILVGYRGAAPCDTDALAELLVNVSRFAAEHKNDLKELDINPVMVYEAGHGVAAADGLVVLKK